MEGEVEHEAGGNCIKIGLPGKSILGDYFQENRTSQSPFLLLRISFPGRPIFIQFIPDRANDLLGVVEGQHVLGRERRVSQLTGGEVAVELRGQTVGPVDRHAGALAGVLESDLERLGLVLSRKISAVNDGSVESVQSIHLPRRG